MDTDGAAGGNTVGAEKNGSSGVGAAQASSDSSDEPAIEPPRTKRARTSSEGGGLSQQQQQQQSSAAAAAVGGKSGGSSPRPGQGNISHQASSSSSSSLAATATTTSTTPTKRKGGIGGGSGKAETGAPGTSVGGRGQEEDTLAAEEARRLEARRRGRQARSPYVYGGGGRVDPNAGLPTSARPPPIALALREGSGINDGEDSKFAVPVRNPAAEVYNQFIQLFADFCVCVQDFVFRSCLVATTAVLL